MSWDSYIDNLIMQAGGAAHADKAAIVGLDGSIWTTAGNANSIQITANEVSKIASCFKKDDFSPFQASGIIIQGVKYTFLRKQDNVVFGKKKNEGSVSIQKSKTAIVIGHCPEGGQQGNLNKGVAVIAEYLESLGM